MFCVIDQLSSHLRKKYKRCTSSFSRLQTSVFFLFPKRPRFVMMYSTKVRRLLRNFKNPLTNGPSSCKRDKPDGCSSLNIGRWENTFTSSCNKHDMCYICVSICLFNCILAFKLFSLSLQTPRYNLACYYVLSFNSTRFCSHFS